MPINISERVRDSYGSEPSAFGWEADVFFKFKTCNFNIFKLCSTLYHDRGGVKGSFSGYYESFKHTLKIFLEKYKVLFFNKFYSRFVGVVPLNAPV